jgi:uncharacterized protein YbjQ (UPF0145 family)
MLYAHEELAMITESTSNETGTEPVTKGLELGNDQPVNDPLAETKQATDRLRTSTSGVMGDVSELANAAAGDAKHYAGSVATNAASAFKEAVETNKSVGANAIVNLARSAQGAADDIEAQSPQIANIVRTAATGVEKLSTDIRDRQVGELVDSITDFAKRQPVAFFACGILAGVVLSRFMRSSDRSA